MPADHTRVAYFSMEIALENDLPTYSGGLGVLAGDTLRAAADLRVPIAAVTLLHRKGYFTQSIDAYGMQHEAPVEWNPSERLREQSQRVRVHVENREVEIRAWRFDVKGPTGHVVPVYLLDTNLPVNDPRDRTITDTLYGGDDRYRLAQEIVLGIGGVRMLRALGYGSIQRFHMNEGHAALLVLELLHERLRIRGAEHVNEPDVEHVRRHCVFTTHTPVPAGHDQFPLHLVGDVVGPFADYVVQQRRDLCVFDGLLNMTHLALNFSGYVNGVAKKHGEVSRAMFDSYAIDWITNGVHAGFWASPAMAELFDRYIPGWRNDHFSLRDAMNIPLEEIWNAHGKAKRFLLREVMNTTGATWDEDALTIGFARRATAYKRHDLLITDPNRLRAIAKKHGPIQVLYAGKAHPKDAKGKEMIQRLVKAQSKLGDGVRLVYLPNYDIDMARALVAGVDVWLNTPMPPMEASGTSGMKAAVNGVPSLSTRDGWWIEGAVEGVTGWSIGDTPDAAAQNHADTASLLYDKLERVVLPCYYNDRERFTNIMRSAIGINGSFFSTHRMIEQYVLKAYFG